jgi:uncharacterized protein (DUF1330 family)
MPAYMIVVAQISDRAAFLASYAVAASALVEKFGGKYVLRAPGAELLEGSFGDGASVVISQWPDKAAVHRFWNSPEYQTAKALRATLANCQILVVEGAMLTNN